MDTPKKFYSLHSADDVQLFSKTDLLSEIYIYIFKNKDEMQYLYDFEK